MGRSKAAQRAYSPAPSQRRIGENHQNYHFQLPPNRPNPPERSGNSACDHRPLCPAALRSGQAWRRQGGSSGRPLMLFQQGVDSPGPGPTSREGESHRCHGGESIVTGGCRHCPAPGGAHRLGNPAHLGQENPKAFNRTSRRSSQRCNFRFHAPIGQVVPRLAICWGERGWARHGRFR